jgi:hypothetical protein
MTNKFQISKPKVQTNPNVKGQMTRRKPNAEIQMTTEAGVRGQETGDWRLEIGDWRLVISD